MTDSNSPGWKRGVLIGLGAIAIVLSILVFIHPGMSIIYLLGIILNPHCWNRENYKWNIYREQVTGYSRTWSTKLSIIIYTDFSYLKSLTFGQLCVDKNLDN